MSLVLSNQEAAEVLEESANLLETRGHCKNFLQNSLGQHCVMGAIMASGVKLGLIVDKYVWHGVRTKATDALDNAIVDFDDIAPYGRAQWSRLVAWNNSRERTATEVIEAVRQAAKDLRNEAKPE